MTSPPDHVVPLAEVLAYAAKIGMGDFELVIRRAIAAKDGNRTDVLIALMEEYDDKLPMHQYARLIDMYFEAANRSSDFGGLLTDRCSPKKIFKPREEQPERERSVRQRTDDATASARSPHLTPVLPAAQLPLHASGATEPEGATPALRLSIGVDDDLMVSGDSEDEAQEPLSLQPRDDGSPPPLIDEDEAEDGHGHQPTSQPTERVVFTAESLKKDKDNETVHYFSQSMLAGSGTANYISHIAGTCQNPPLGALLMSSMLNMVNDWSGKLLGASPAAAEAGMPAWNGIKVMREPGGQDKASIAGINVVGASSTGKTNAIMTTLKALFGDTFEQRVHFVHGLADSKGGTMSGNPAAALNSFAAHHDAFKDVYNLGTDDFDPASLQAELLNGLPPIAFRHDDDRLRVERLCTRLPYVLLIDEADKMNQALQSALLETMVEKGVISCPNGDSPLVRGVLYLVIAISNVPASSECDLPASVNQEGKRIFEVGPAVMPGPRGVRRPCMVQAGIGGDERQMIDISGAMTALSDGSLKPLQHAFMRARDAKRQQSLLNRWDPSTIIPVADTRSEKEKLSHLTAIAIANVLSSFQRGVLADAPEESALRGLASTVAVTVDCTDTFRTNLQEVLTKVQEGHDQGFTGQASSRTEESFILNLAVTLGQQAALTAIRRQGELLQGDDDERLVLWLRTLRDSATELLQLSPDAERHAPARSPLALAPPRLAARAAAPGGRGAAQLAIASEPHVECAALGKARAASAAAVTPRPALLFARGKGPDVEAQVVRVNDGVAMRFLSTGTLNAIPREKVVVNAYGHALPVNQLREFAQSKGCTTAPQFLSRYCGAVQLAVMPSSSVSTSTLPCEAAVTAPYGASTAPEGTSRPEVVLGVCCAPLGPGQQCPCDSQYMGHFTPAGQRPGRQAHKTLATLEVVAAAMAGAADDATSAAIASLEANYKESDGAARALSYAEGRTFPLMVSRPGVARQGGVLGAVMDATQIAAITASRPGLMSFLASEHGRSTLAALSKKTAWVAATQIHRRAAAKAARTRRAHTGAAGEGSSESDDEGAAAVGVEVEATAAAVPLRRSLANAMSAAAPPAAPQIF